jgi:hypothetical protein
MIVTKICRTMYTKREGNKLRGVQKKTDGWQNQPSAAFQSIRERLLILFFGTLTIGQCFFLHNLTIFIDE